MGIKAFTSFMTKQLNRVKSNWRSLSFLETCKRKVFFYRPFVTIYKHVKEKFSYRKTVSGVFDCNDTADIILTPALASPPFKQTQQDFKTIFLQSDTAKHRIIMPVVTAFTGKLEIHAGHLFSLSLSLSHSSFCKRDGCIRLC